jgi:2'-5' RNA ligase
LLAWNYGVGSNDAEAHVDLYRNRIKETENMEISIGSGKSTFIILRPESEDYPALFKLSEETARVVDGTPVIDLHLTIQAIRNVHDFDALSKNLKEYAATLQPFEIRARNIARMNVDNQSGKLWLLADKSPFLEKLYDEIGQIARKMGFDIYPYNFQNWLPHIKIVDLPENTTTQIKDPTFGTGNGISFKVRQLEWTVQKGPELWEMLDKFPFSEDTTS